eukprot:NODE_4085_length_497_cov_65.178571_g3489_i0.p1 GENE.NODE_4085_length_497_cov_65.178571_g3489_i0~~NODE_4085_length_497_cov_65.178571_g3489_i0.p1  ORF type:complete len:76 (-),score=8.09 NODE_4085_length_497_cov_65.178571_g3489_i0:200-427(-)
MGTCPSAHDCMSRSTRRANEWLSPAPAEPEPEPVEPQIVEKQSTGGKMGKFNISVKRTNQESMDAAQLEKDDKES